jgi:hypothetical protein
VKLVDELFFRTFPTVFALGYLPPELQPLIPALTQALKHDEYEIRRAALSALSRVGPHRDVEAVLPTFAETALTDAHADIAVKTLQIMLACGPDAASVAIPNITVLLQREEAIVRVEACRALMSFQTEAVSAVPALVSLIRQAADQESQHYALFALAAIDRDAISTAAQLTEKPGQSAFLALLRAVGSDVRAFRLRLQARWSERERLPDASSDKSSQTTPPYPSHGARHSLDFRSICWFGTVHSFTSTQAAVLKLLWESWEQGTPEVGGDTLLVAADSTAQSLRHVFRGHPTWGTMIIQGRRGTYRLNPPASR